MNITRMPLSQFDATSEQLQSGDAQRMSRDCAKPVFAIFSRDGFCMTESDEGQVCEAFAATARPSSRPSWRSTAELKRAKAVARASVEHPDLHGREQGSLSVCLSVQTGSSMSLCVILCALEPLSEERQCASESSRNTHTERVHIDVS